MAMHISTGCSDHSTGIAKIYIITEWCHDCHRKGHKTSMGVAMVWIQQCLVHGMGDFLASTVFHLCFEFWLRHCIVGMLAWALSQDCLPDRYRGSITSYANGQAAYLDIYLKSTSQTQAYNTCCQWKQQRNDVLMSDRSWLDAGFAMCCECISRQHSRVHASLVQNVCTSQYLRWVLADVRFVPQTFWMVFQLQMFKEISVHINDNNSSKFIPS